MCAELLVTRSHRMVTTPRESEPACRGGGAALSETLGQSTSQ